MKPLLLIIGLGLASSLCAAQLRVENPKHLDFPKAKAEVLLSTACRVVGEEFNAQHSAEANYPLTLVLGVKDEHWSEDEEGHTYTLYLNDWNEAKFAIAAMRLALQRLITRDRRNRLTREILRRSDQIAPVAASKLHDSRSELLIPRCTAPCEIPTRMPH